jgi:uncharacterized protein YjbJ (UPF0337 family)
MNKDQLAGKTKEVTGTVKDKAGEATGDRDLEAEGEGERTEGKAQGALGKAKEALGDAADAVKDAVKR